jgi:leader peptidase (prepilin peptidase) / N-methyltransferase
MVAILLVGFGMLGACVGSFLNVVIYRLPRQCKSIVRPSRSFCPHCRAMIAWFDNIPVVSWCVLRAKCRHCGAKISGRYAVVELLTASMFVWVAWHFLGVAEANVVANPASLHWGLALSFAWFISLLIAASFIDLELTIIPDEITLTGIAVAPILVVAFPQIHPAFAEIFPYADTISSTRMVALLGCLFGMAVGAGSIYLMGLLGKMLFRKEAMGMGDVKFMAVVGAMVGWDATLLSIVLACLVGSVFGIIIKLASGNQYVPFGPYLSVGAVATIFYREELMNFLLVQYPSILFG